VNTTTAIKDPNEESQTNVATQLPRTPLTGAAWGLALIPLLLLGLVISYIVATGGGLQELAGPPVEQIKIQRITLPESGRIMVEIVNDGPQAVTIAQVIVDDAYWQYTASPSNVIPRFGKTTFNIPYPWVNEEAHMIVFLTNIGTTFEAEVPVAVQTPPLDLALLLRFALIGLYVGVVPISLGLLWYPFMRRLSRTAMNFILALTVGLLLYLAVGTWLDATEFAADVPVFWQGVPLALFMAVITFGAIVALSNRAGKKLHQDEGLSLAYRIGLGIGLHNLGEGLAIGAAFASGQAALGTLLIIGFTLHNITEGVGIAAPIVNHNPGIKHFVLLALLAGTPAIFGTLIGSYAFDPVLATVFMGIGLGAIVQVIWEVGKLIARSNAKHEEPVVNWVNLSGVALGIAIMFVTAFLVKF
jgi:zinc transporter ZupT